MDYRRRQHYSLLRLRALQALSFDPSQKNAVLSDLRSSPNITSPHRTQKRHDPYV